MTRKASKILLYVSISVLAALFAAAGFTQTTLFRKTVRSTLYKLVESNLNASVYIGEIRGNIFTGFSVDTVAMYVNNAPFVEARNVVLSYDPLPLWYKRLSVASLEIDNPSISLIRFSDGTWNVDRLAKKKSTPDSLPSPWVVAIRSLHIKDAHFRLIDSMSQSNSESPDQATAQTFNFSNLDLQKINIELSATLSEQEQSVSVKNISFVSPREEFTLSKFSGDIHHSLTASEVKNLLVVTPRSHIELSARVKSVDAFKIKDIAALQFTPVEASISSTVVAAEDLQKFLPSLNFLRGSTRLECSLAGEFGAIQVTKLQAAFDHSTINLSGTVSNLHRPMELTLNIESKGTLIQPSDVPKLLPFFHIPDYGNVGNLALDFHYVGRPLDFQVAATASTPAGQITVDGGLDLTGQAMKYQAIFGGSSVNLEKVFSKSSLRSYLNFSGAIQGEGTSIDELYSAMTIDFDSSSFGRIPISHLHVTANAEEKKISLAAILRSPKGDISLESIFDYTSEASKSYSLKGVGSHVDLAAVFDDDHYDSDCSFALNANGKDFLTERMTSNLQVEFLPSRFGAYTFDSTRAELHLQLDSLGRKTIRLTSPIADVSIDGTFSYDGILQTVTSHVNAMQLVYDKQRTIFDSTFVPVLADTNRNANVRTAHTDPGSQNDIHYMLRLKNLEPLAIFIGTDVFNVVGDIEGTLRGNSDSLSAQGSLSIHSGKYPLKNSLLLVDKGSLDYKFENLTHDSLLAVLNGPTLTLHMNAAGVFVGEKYFRNPSIDFTFHNRRAEYSVKGEVDSTIIVGIDGRAVVTPDLYQFTFDNFSLRYQGYELNNAGQFSARINRDGVSVDSALFTHQDERLIFGGTISYQGAIGAFVQLENFTLSNIHYFGTSQDFKSSALAFGGTVNALGAVGGTMRDPELTCKLTATDFAFRGTEFGFVSSSIHYKAKVADFSIQLSKTEQSPDDYKLLCSGSIPMDMGFTSVENRFSLPGMDMYLKARNFDISIIDPFIAQVDELNGTLEGSIHATGSLESPLFGGSMELSKCEFFFPMNSMKYQAVGKFDLDGNRFSFTTFSVKNLYEDFSSGKVDVGGYITLRDFVPDEYHLNAKGELMVLQSSSANINQGVYGDLIASTGPDAFLFDGTYAHSRVSGAVFVKQASLTFPSSRQSANQISSRYINIVVVDDTSKPSEDTLVGPNIFAFFRPKKDAPSSNAQSFLDGLGYDLIIQTDGIVQIRMVFNASTNEELFADLNGKLTMSKEGNNVRLSGTITVSEKSNYKFYKQFDASGTLKFTGSPENPQLDIKATYAGTHNIKSDVIPPPKEKVVVSLAITGTRLDPKIKIGLSTIDDNGNETERTGDVESDAISFLLTSTPGTPGKFREDLTSNDKQNIASSLGGSISGSLISGFTNTLLSGMMLDFLRANNFNAVSTVELTYSGRSPDLRLSGVIGDAYWTFGGMVFSDINNANISLQWSLGSIIQSQRMRNFMFELNRKIDPLETSDVRRPTSGARFYYRFAF
jgi:hypothetical protein